MVRITKMPYIQEDTDSWGRPMGVFTVVDVQGEIGEDKWIEIQEFEGYYNSEGASKDEILVKEYIKENLKSGDPRFKPLELPHLSKVLGYSGNKHVWQFNLPINRLSEEATEYFSACAFFGEVTFREWTPEHDEKVKFLEKVVFIMNSLKITK